MPNNAAEKAFLNPSKLPHVFSIVAPNSLACSNLASSLPAGARFLQKSE
jgi:hypothetical protein